MRFILSAILVLVAVMPSFGKTAREFFASDTTAIIFPMLSQSSRLDMLDYYNVGASKETENLLGGKSILLKATSQYLRLKMSDVSSLEVWIPDTVSAKTVYIVNRTYLTPTPDGVIDVYDSDLQKLDKVFEMPEAKDFVCIPKKDKKKVKDVVDMVDMLFLSFEIDAETGMITATQNLDTFLVPEEYKALKPYLLKSIRYKWTGKRYKLMKQTD